MRPRRFVVVCVALFALALVWNALVHLVVLRATDASVRHLYRPDLADKLGLSLALTACVVTLFAWGWTRFAREGSLKEGVGYGGFFALVAGVLVDLNQYVLFPIPGGVALRWFAAGLVEFAGYGALVSRLLPARRC